MNIFKKKIFKRDNINMPDLTNILTNKNGHLIRKNKIIFKRKEKIINETENIVNINGSMFTAEKWLGYIPPSESLIYYDIDLNLDNKGSIPTSETPVNERVFLFCMANTGCDKGLNALKKTSYNSRIKPNELIPFRCVPTGTSLDSKYVGKKTDGQLDKYYFKEFDCEPQFRRMCDNTILNTLYENIDKEVITYSEINMSINKYDFREHFKLIGEPLNCAVSSMELCSALKTIVNNKVIYTRIRPVTLAHFMTESLIEENKEMDIYYHLYS